MSHHHPPRHEHHSHHPHRSHAGSADQGPTAEERLGMLLEHWIKHNENHVQTYHEWAQKAAALGMHDVRARIEEAVDLTLAASRRFEEALKRVREQG